MGGFCPILNLKQFNHYMHIPTSKMPTIRQVWLLIQQGDYAFPIDLMDSYLHISIVKHYHNFLRLVWQCKHLSRESLPFGLAMAPRVFTTLTKPIQHLSHCKVCMLFFTWVICLFLLAPRLLIRELKISCTLFWFILDYILIFPNLTSISHSNFLFRAFVVIQ